jgi:putative copper export protein
MMTAGIFLVHWLHIFAAATWLGLVAGTYFIMVPVILQAPAAQSRATWGLFAARMNRLAPIMGQATLLLGLLRGTVFGPIRSFGDLIGTSYGHTFLTALILTIVTSIHGATAASRFEKKVWNGDQYLPGAAAALRKSGVISLTLFALILACMAIMRLGI